MSCIDSILLTLIKCMLCSLLLNTSTTFFTVIPKYNHTNYEYLSKNTALQAVCGLHLWHITIKCNSHPYCFFTIHSEACAGPSPSVETAKTPDLSHHQPPAELPSHWKDHLPPFQHEWIRNTLFKANPRTGKPELVSQLKLWWYPPQPPLINTQPPASPDLFFCRPLFLWMPLKMWLFPLVCGRPNCGKHRLTAAGLYRTVRKVLDIDGWYDLATEYLECKRCKKKYPAWSEDILGQLDMGHRSQFPALLTYR